MSTLEDLRDSLTETIVSLMMISGILCWDFIVNLSKSAGLPIFPQELGAHPVNLGTMQVIGIIIICTIQLVRKEGERKYC